MILVQSDKVEFYTKQINEFKAIRPIKIKTPDAYILPESILEDPEIIESVPELLDLELIDKKDIVFIESEI